MEEQDNKKGITDEDMASQGIMKPEPRQRRKNVVRSVFLVMSLVVVAAALTFFILYQTGFVHVTKQLSDGSIFSGYWKMGEPFGEGVLVTANGELIEGTWDDGELKSGVVIARSGHTI